MDQVAAYAHDVLYDHITFVFSFNLYSRNKSVEILKSSLLVLSLSWFEYPSE